ncbi:MAG: glycosyltransferase family 92 protein [Chlamydiota bacterium]
MCTLQSLCAYEVVVASMFRNTAPYLKEWVEYHKMVGVDHFWLYNDASTDNWEEVLQPYIEEGLVEVFYWPASGGFWVPAQMAAFADGARRALGVAKWIALIDQDEFLLPVLDKTIPECLKRRFSDAPAIYVNWLNFGTSGISLEEESPMLFRLTACSKKTHSRNAVGKSIFRPECADIGQMWSPHFCPLKPGYSYVNGDCKKTLIAVGSDLKTDGEHHSKYIRINHYAHRDEKYFFNIRLPRDSERGLMLKHYKEYNKERDYTIVDFIKRNHKSAYKKIWKNR